MTSNDWVQLCLANPNDSATKLVFADWLEEREDPRCHLLRFTTQLLAETPPFNPIPPDDLPCRVWANIHGRYVSSRGDWPPLPAPAYPPGTGHPVWCRSIWTCVAPLYRLLKTCIYRWGVADQGVILNHELMACRLTSQWWGRNRNWEGIKTSQYCRKPWTSGNPYSCRNLVEVFVSRIRADQEDYQSWLTLLLQRRAAAYAYFRTLIQTFNRIAPWDACRAVTARFRVARGDGRIMIVA